MAIAAHALHVPSGHPARDGVRSADLGDVRWALTRAARYLAAGGDRDQVAAFVDEWLDYEAELRLREEIAAL